MRSQKCCPGEDFQKNAECRHRLPSAAEWRSLKWDSLNAEREEDSPTSSAVFFLLLIVVHPDVQIELGLICVLSVTQVFDVETSDMLLEIKTSRLSMVQYCHACPTSNLLAIAFSNYAVEVQLILFIDFLFKVLNATNVVVVFQLWDLEANKKMADCSGHLSWVQGVQFSPDGSQLLSCSDDQTVRVRLCLRASALLTRLLVSPMDRPPKTWRPHMWT